MVSLFGPFGHESLDDRDEFFRRLGNQFGDRIRLFGLVGHHFFDGTAFGERHAAGEAAIKNAAERILVAGRRPIARLHDAFGAGVIQPARQRVRRGHRIDERFAFVFNEQAPDAEVENLGLVVRADHDVRRLEQAVEEIVLVRDRQALGDVHADEGRLIRGQFSFLRDHGFERFSFGERPRQVMQSAGRAHVHERHDGRMLEIRERSDLPAGQPDVPHAAAGQHFHRILLRIVFRRGLIDLAHASLADGVEQDVRPQHEALRLAVEHPFGLKLGQRAVLDEILSERRGFRPRIFLHEFIDDLVELTAVDQAASAQIPHEPFAGAEIVGDHRDGFLLPMRGRFSVRRKFRTNCAASDFCPNRRTPFPIVKLGTPVFTPPANRYSFQTVHRPESTVSADPSLRDVHGSEPLRHLPLRLRQEV